MTIFRIDSAFRVAVVYAGFGTLWILASDALMFWNSGRGVEDWGRDSIKGLVFIAITAALLYFLVRRLLRRHLAMERELQAARKRWQFAMESAGTGTWEWSSDSGEIWFSTEWKSMLGYTDQELPNRQEEWQSRVHPEDRPRVDKQVQRHLDGETPVYECEFRMRTKDGSYKWILARGVVVERHPDGRPRLAFGTHTDITDRKNAEARIVDALAFVQTILRTSPVGVLVYGADGRAVIANESAARIVGADVTALLRQNFRELESWRRAGFLDAAERALATDRPETQKTPLLTTFGRQLQADVHFVPFDFRGTRHLLVLISDETVERDALDNLRLLHAALEAAPSACVITNADGLIEWVNPAFTRMTGYTAAEAVGQNPRMLRSGRHGAEFYRQFWEKIRSGEVWSGEISNRRKDGTTYDEHMTVAPVRGNDGVIRHFVAIKDDVTEQKRLERQLTRTQRLESIGMLASGIAHDLNNVLTPILLSVELLRAKYPDVDAGKYLDTVQTAAQRGAGIVRQVLTFARGMDGGECTEVQPRYLLKDLVRLIEETFPRNIEIAYDVPREVRAVLGDVTQLHQVLLNLAVNARDAMPEGGRLTLSARNATVAAGGEPAQLKPGAYVVLAVSDTGTGIAPEVQEHMFEPFYTTKPRGKGTGLGLSTVYGIVRNHGGTIEVRTAPGQGSTFEVFLPAAPVAAVASGPVEAAPPLRGEGRRVLVVDDEESIRSVTTRVLGRHGFVPVQAVDGADGLRQYQAEPNGFAVVIVDMLMPRMNGIELVRAIRTLNPTQPVIVSTGLMTAETEPGLDIDLRGIGVRTLLRKPYGEEELMRSLTQELGASTEGAGDGI